MVELLDVQNMPPNQKKKIKKVGVRNIFVPIIIRDPNGERVSTVAEVSIYTSLVPTVRGSHMSRYLEILHDVIDKEVGYDIISSLLKKLRRELHSSESYIKFRFMYFVKKKSPVTKKEGYMNYKCILEGESKNGKDRLFLTVKVPYMSLCPCSKEISDRGAHNQRSEATVKVQLIKKVSISEIIQLVERVASCDLYSILKRQDEKYVTEKAYNNPMFVEDMCREISSCLDKWLDDKIADYFVVVNHFESIHNHDAVAVITAGRDLK